MGGRTMPVPGQFSSRRQGGPISRDASLVGGVAPRSETAFYVCQVYLSAAEFNKAVQAHWSIENRNHYVGEVTLGEDHSRIRVQPGPFTRIRSFALNILPRVRQR